MNAPSDEDQMDTLWEFVRDEPRQGSNLDSSDPVEKKSLAAIARLSIGDFWIVQLPQ